MHGRLIQKLFLNILIFGLYYNNILIRETFQQQFYFVPFVC